MVFIRTFIKYFILLLWGCIQLSGPAFASYVQGPQTDPQQHREREKYKNKISRFEYVTTRPKSSVLTFNFSLCPLKLILNFQYRLLKSQRSLSKPRTQKQVLCHCLLSFSQTRKISPHSMFCPFAKTCQDRRKQAFLTK